MLIKKMRISNFKSFGENVSVELGNFNMMIGGNASGKSNFIHIFRFLKDVSQYGLENAVSAQGGGEFLTNLKLPKMGKMELQVTVETDSEFPYFRKEMSQSQTTDIFALNEIDYTLTLNLTQAKRVRSVQEKCILKGEISEVELEKLEDSPWLALDKGRKAIARGELTIDNLEGKISGESAFDKGFEAKLEEVIPRPFLAKKIGRKGTILANYAPWIPLGYMIREMSLFDFDPKMAKKPVQLAGKATLDEDGGNLALAIRTVLAKKGNRWKFTNLLSDILPFVGRLDTKQSMDKCLLFKLTEKYYQRRSFYPPFVSDGTVNIIALLLAVYFHPARMIVIEEPERNIHPHLISRIVEMMKDASQQKQILVTTHNPEMVKHAGIENLLLISRDKTGYSSVSRPKDVERIAMFLEKEIGVDKLFVSKMLER